MAKETMLDWLVAQSRLSRAQVVEVLVALNKCGMYVDEEYSLKIAELASAQTPSMHVTVGKDQHGRWFAKTWHHILGSIITNATKAPS